MNNLTPQQLSNLFNTDELRELCLELEITCDDLVGDTRTGRCISLIEYAQRHGRYDALVAYVQKARPGQAGRPTFPLNNLPHHNPNFTGRQPELGQLHQNLSVG
jgi:hypothetical protein